PPAQPFWWVIDSTARSLYVSLRAVVPGPQSNSNRALWDQVFALVDSAAPRRVVIDLRENLGGNGFLNRYPIQQILARPALNRSDRLFVVIRRRTFSAGKPFTNPAGRVAQSAVGRGPARAAPQPVRGSPAARPPGESPPRSDLLGVSSGAQRFRPPLVRPAGDLHAVDLDRLPPGD